MNPTAPRPWAAVGALLVAFTLVGPVSAAVVPVEWTWRGGDPYQFAFSTPRPPEGIPIVLERGQTISALAEDRGLSVDAILTYNQIRSPRLLRAGQTLLLPPADGVLLRLDEPQTPLQLAASYRIFPTIIAGANGAESVSQPLSGAVFLPGVKLDRQERRAVIGELFAWPTIGGRISSRFGRRNDPFTGKLTSHSGVDIANRYGAPVLAAGAGRVVTTGYNSILGNHIVVDQGQGYKAVYGHLSKIQTKVGRQVIAGQRIGLIGSTGYSTGPHLHFTAYKNNRLIDPMTLFE